MNTEEISLKSDLTTLEQIPHSMSGNDNIDIKLNVVDEQYQQMIEEEAESEIRESLMNDPSDKVEGDQMPPDMSALNNFEKLISMGKDN